MIKLKYRGTTYLLLGILALGVLLRTATLTVQSIDGDEAFSYTISTQSLPDMFSVLQRSPTGFLYYLIMHFWLLLGKSDFIVRFPSAVFGSLSVLGIYLAARELCGKDTALLSAFLLALSPTNIYLSQYAKTYALTTVLSIFLMYFFLRALRLNRIRDWMVHFIFGILAVWSFPFVCSLLIAEAVYILIYFRRFRAVFSGWLLSLAAIGAFYAPHLVYRLKVAVDTAVSGKTADAWLLQYYRLNAQKNIMDYTGLFINAVRNTIADYTFGGYLNLDLTLLRRLMVLLAPILFITGCFYYIRKRQLQKTVFLICYFGVPFIAGFAISVFFLHSLRQFGGRYYLFISIPLYIAIASGMAYFKERRRKAIFACLTAIFTAALLYSYARQSITLRHPDYRAAAGFLAEKLRPGEVVYCYPAHMAVILGYCRPGKFTIRGIPGDYLLLRDFNKTEAGHTFSGKDFAQLDRNLKGRGEFWFFYFDSSLSDPKRQLGEWFSKNFSLKYSKIYDVPAMKDIPGMEDRLKMEIYRYGQKS